MAPNPANFIVLSDIYGPKPYKFTGFGDIHGPKVLEGPKALQLYCSNQFLLFLGFLLWFVLGPGGLREAPGGPGKAHGGLWGASRGSPDHPRMQRHGGGRGEACLDRALQKVLVFRFFDLVPGGSGGPREAPRAIRGPSRDPRGPPGGPRNLRQTKAKNLET